MKLLTNQARVEIAAEAVEAYKSEEARKLPKSYTENTEEMRGECTTAFNFADANVRVFGVERVNMGDAVNEKTIVGYYFANDAKTNTIPTIKEWSLYCSRKTHNELVQLFSQGKLPTTPKKNKELLKG